MGATVKISERLSGPDIPKGFIEKQMANALVDKIMQEGLVVIERKPQDREYSVHLNAVIGVVEPKIVDGLERRAREIATIEMPRLANRAIEEIMIWGSAFGDTHISKQRAIESIRKAEHEVMKAVLG